MHTEENTGERDDIACGWCGADESDFRRNGTIYETGPDGEIYVTGRDQEAHNYFDARCSSCGWQPLHMSNVPAPWTRQEGKKELYLEGVDQGKVLAYINMLHRLIADQDPECECRICEGVRNIPPYPESERLMPPPEYL